MCKRFFPRKGAILVLLERSSTGVDDVPWLESHREIKIHPAVNYLEFHLWEERERKGEGDGTFESLVPNVTDRIKLNTTNHVAALISPLV